MDTCVRRRQDVNQHEHHAVKLPVWVFINTLFVLSFALDAAAYVKTRIVLLNGGTHDIRRSLSDRLTIVIQGINQAAENPTSLSQMEQFYERFCTGDGLVSIRLLVQKPRPYCSQSEVAANLIDLGNGMFEVRNVPVNFWIDSKKVDNSKSIVFKIDSNLKIVRVDFAIEQDQLQNVLTRVRSPRDTAHIKAVVNFLERLKTAYIEEDLEFIKNVFSERALIIVGFVMHPHGANEAGANFLSSHSSEEIYRFKRTKKDYIQRLSRIFRECRTIDVKYDSIRVVKMSNVRGVYAANLVQRWESENENSKKYQDTGSLSFIMDFREPNKVTIWVRVWQSLEEYRERPFEPGTVPLFQ